jgi:hypothetical protein
MKNIHVISTDKPSRLYSYKSIELFLHPTIIDANVSNFHCKNQNIYITSDEEIKEGVDQWYLDKFLNKPRCSGGAQYGENQNIIILTTDQDLIKDGVQAIDDEFLEWFVKNPSCEFVKVYQYKSINLKKMGIFYKIIIPQEEPKQETENFKNFKKLVSDEISPAMKDFIKEKQETLEEAFDRIYDSMDFTELDFASFKLGAKWQAKRMYSEEDIRESFRQGHKSSQAMGSYNSITEQEDFDKWFEQFKKK